MGCVRDTGSEEELATVGKLLGEVDRCREPSQTLCQAITARARHLLSLTPSRLRCPFLPRAAPPEHKRFALPNTDDTSKHLPIAPARGMLSDRSSIPIARNKYGTDAPMHRPSS